MQMQDSETLILGIYLAT